MMNTDVPACRMNLCKKVSCKKSLCKKVSCKKNLCEKDSCRKDLGYYSFGYRR